PRGSGSCWWTPTCRPRPTRRAPWRRGAATSSPAGRWRSSGGPAAAGDEGGSEHREGREDEPAVGALRPGGGRRRRAVPQGAGARGEGERRAALRAGRQAGLLLLGGPQRVGDQALHVRRVDVREDRDVVVRRVPLARDVQEPAVLQREERLLQPLAAGGA